MSAWRTAEAMVTGESHDSEGKPCQDHCLVDAKGGYLLVAVADGAGSAAHSDRGANKACTEAILFLKQLCDQPLNVKSARIGMSDAFAAARRKVQELASDESIDVREMSSTLLVALVGVDFAVFGQVGDGAAIYGVGQEIRLVHWPEQEAMNVTDFLTSAPLYRTHKIVDIRARVDRLALMTDGLTHLLLDFKRRAPHEPAVERLLCACRESPDPAALNENLRAFLKSAPVTERSDDDKTLVLATREAVA